MDALQHGAVDLELVCEILDRSALLGVASGYRFDIKLAFEDVRIQQGVRIEVDGAVYGPAGGEEGDEVFGWTVVEEGDLKDNLLEYIEGDLCEHRRGGSTAQFAASPAGAFEGWS